MSPGVAAPTALPVVLVPVGADEDALDACLAALDAATPAGTRVWLADDAQAGPRGMDIIRRWLARTALQAAHTRRSAPLGEAAHLDEALRACGEADVAVLAGDARPTPGWLERLAECLARDPRIATATPWSNAGEAAGWPRLGEIVPLAEPAARLARACADLPPLHPELPAAGTHAVLLRGAARVRAGGLDAASYRSWYAALVDLSLRLSGLGGRNVLCETAFVLREREDAPADGDTERLAVRWPAWHARLGHFLMDDPLRGVRDALATQLRTAPAEPPQRDLFADPS